MATDTLVLGRTLDLSLAYRYWRPSWDAPKNAAIYGTDASAEGLGGNWRVELTATGTEDEEIFIPAFQWIKKNYDHVCLFDRPPFDMEPSTLEVCTRKIAQELADRPPRSGAWRELSITEADRWTATVKIASPLEADLCLSLSARGATVTLRGPLLNDQSGLMARRSQILDAVEDLFVWSQKKTESDVAEWNRAVFQQLQRSLPNLHSWRVDLGRQEAWQLTATN